MLGIAQVPNRSAADDLAVIAKNFPAAWVAPAALSSLPSKVQSLLQRIGTLTAVPTVSQGQHGIEAVARFQTTEALLDAVKTLHGTDLRTQAEKRACNFEPPKENERFWLQPLVQPVLPGYGIPHMGAVGLVLASRAPAAGAGAQKRIRPNGVYLTPLPQGWAENDVLVLASPYGTVHQVRMEKLKTGQQAAYIDFQKDDAAQGALTGLDGLSLMGVRLRCTMQETPEPPRPITNFAFYVDELAIPARPEVLPKLDDREVFCGALPQEARTEESARSWFAAFGKVEEVFLLKDHRLVANGKTYARFCSHEVARDAIAASAKTGADGATQLVWSESERLLQGTHGPYGLNVMRRLCGEGGAQLQVIRQSTGVLKFSVGSTDGEQQQQQQAPQACAPQLHFIVRCDDEAKVEDCKARVAAELAKMHEAFVREVQGSLMLRGFPSSWSEKGLKFVFAPFGGLASVAFGEISEERIPEDSVKAQNGAATTRLAYVRLRNAAGMHKAVSSLHRTKVGDGDLVEECVVECQRWHLRGWSDGSFHVGIFVDQLTMNRRPSKVEPGPEDKELFVRNLPLQDMNRQQLQEYFEGFGEVDDLCLIRDPFTDDLVGEGYVRFKQHRDARRCMEALTPDQEAEPNDLIGSWSESERMLQRKGNCYKFNLIAELVGKDGANLERLRLGAKLKGLWVLAESVKQKDQFAPRLVGKQLHFAGRFSEEAHIQLLRDLVEQALEEAHARISERTAKRKRKAAEQIRPDGSAWALPPSAAPAAGPAASPAEGSAWTLPPATVRNPPPAMHVDGVLRPPPGAVPYGYPGMMPGQALGQLPPMGYPGMVPPPGAGPWPRPPPSATPTVFEAARPALDGQQPQRTLENRQHDGEGEEKRPRSRSRRRKHRGGGGEKDRDKEKKHRRRRRREEKSGSADAGQP
mmetsp:Transcript_89318/g.251430  ORF Transcript_89318/g.251430 Transcript_89318/m.251430 type:complete len:921 (+) Transcript_89318:103-2865(+)